MLVTLKLDGLTCPSCMTKIKGALSNFDGVDDVKVLFNSSKVKAKIDDKKVVPDDLSQAITNLGYDVVNVSSQEV